MVFLKSRILLGESRKINDRSCTWAAVRDYQLIKTPPAAEASLAQGEVSLSTASLLQSFFQAEKKLGKPYTPEAKAEVFEKIKGKSAREAIQIFASISPEAIPREKERILTESETQITFVASKTLREKLARLRGLPAAFV